MVGPRIALVGLGLIGGSLARLLQARGASFVAWDPDPTTRSLARSQGIATVDDLSDIGESAPELAVVAAPLRSAADVLTALAPVLPVDATVTDVGSVKAPVREWARAAGFADRYVGAHPMAGTELTGFEASDAALLDRVTWAVTVDDETARKHLERVLWLVIEATRSRALVLSDADHDGAVALISQLPHVFAAQLLAQAEGSPLAGAAHELAAGSFRDGTRVARGDAARSEAMVVANAGAVKAAIQSALADLTALAESLDASTALSADGVVTDFFARLDRSHNEDQSPKIGDPDRIGWQSDWQTLSSLPPPPATAVVGYDDTGLTLL